MSVYTVHQPPLRKGETAPDPERFVFVRDGFYFWAFVLTPIWILRYRLWLVLLLYVLLSVTIGYGLSRLGAPGVVKFLVTALLGLLIGFEAATLRRWTYQRRKWKTLGIVVGDDHESAERRFFSAWVEAQEAERPAPVPERLPTVPVRRGPPTGSDVIGLFPEPGAPR